MEYALSFLFLLFHVSLLSLFLASFLSFSRCLCLKACGGNQSVPAPGRVCRQMCLAVWSMFLISERLSLSVCVCIQYMCLCAQHLLVCMNAFRLPSWLSAFSGYLPEDPGGLTRPGVANVGPRGPVYYRFCIFPCFNTPDPNQWPSTSCHQGQHMSVNDRHLYQGVEGGKHPEPAGPRPSRTGSGLPCWTRVHH